MRTYKSEGVYDKTWMGALWSLQAKKIEVTFFWREVKLGTWAALNILGVRKRAQGTIQRQKEEAVK